MLKFISNFDGNKSHKNALIDLFADAIKLDWNIAFATQGGFDEITDELENFLDAGNSARIIIGLDYFHTDPEVLDCLFSLSQEYPDQLDFYISGPESERVFHPKTYVFYYEDEDGEKFAKILIGSANLTSGGLEGNIEFSAQFMLKLDEDGESPFIRNLERQIAAILESEEVAPASQELIEKYRIEHRYHKLHQALAKRKASESIEKNSTNFCEYYKVVLEDFKNRPNGEDFSSNVKGRLQNRKSALTVLNNMSSQQTWTYDDFLAQYRLLVSKPHYFHSGMINIQQGSVANDRQNFIDGLRALESQLNHRNAVSAKDAYNILHQFFAGRQNGVSGAGVNVMTEILHAYDNQSYAVMNKLSVDRLGFVLEVDYPESLPKNQVTGEMYEDFCRKSKQLCDCLGLKNFTEFDALMNFDYWK